MEIFGKTPEDVLIGNYLNCYVGHSKDHGIRYHSSSGGLVTQLLIFALEKGIIDGALVTRMSDKDPLRPEPFIAKTKEEIICASKSKYCPVPANVALKEILNKGGRFAVVGLPCHIHGVRKAMSTNKKLRESVRLTFGLMCSYNRSFFATEYVLQRLGTTKRNVVKLDYRGDGYLGSMRVKLKNGREKSVPFVEYYTRWLRSFFFLPRCTLCIDHTCEVADISFGDNWLPEFQEESVGSSIIICRTKPAEELVAAALSNGSIELSDVECGQVVQSKREALLRKKSYIGARVTLFKLFGRRTPIYDQPPLKGEPFAYLDAVATYLQIYISSKRRLWPLLSKFAIFLRLASTLRESEHTDSRSYRKRPNLEQRQTNRLVPRSCGHVMTNACSSRLVMGNLISRTR
jgi:coenzyme F420 hydrogenase subunit beta